METEEFDPIYDLDIEARCSPRCHDAIHSFELTGKVQDRSVSKLRALRYSQMDFEFETHRLEQMVWAFDHESQESYDLAEEVRGFGPALARRFGEWSTCGIVAILEVQTDPEMVGKRIGLELVRYLRELHLGLPWFACLYAVPFNFEHGSPEQRKMQERLINHYASDIQLGFARARIGTPLMVAGWSGETEE